MTSKKIAHIIFHKETCYGMYDDKTPSDEELVNYFSKFIDEYAKEYHETKIVSDVEKEKSIEEKKLQWWVE